MAQRLNWIGKSNGGVDAMRNVEAWLAENCDPVLLALVKMRASQINGCAYCLHMHSREAHKHGETEARLLLLDAWRESKLYSEKERAALAWTEALTKITEGHASDQVYEDVRQRLSEEELVAISIAIAMINAWNRLSIGFRAAHPSDVAKAA